MKKYKSIRIEKDYDKLIKSLVAHSSLETEKEYTEAMLNYFQETGIDPLVRIKPVSAEISKLNNQVNWFVREFEKKKFRPLINDFDELYHATLKFIKEKALQHEEIKDILDSNMLIKTQILEAIESIKNNNSDKAKALFSEFLKQLKPGLNYYKIEKKIVKHFENQFNSL